VTVTTTDGKAYAVALELAPMTCTLKAHVDGEALAIDSPDTRGRSNYVDLAPEEGPPFQVCRLKAFGYDGDVNVHGRARSTGTDQLSVTLQLYPRATPTNGVGQGSLATMTIERASRHRQL
jgi:hypothetical protein